MMLVQGNSATGGAFHIASLKPKEISGRTITPNKIGRPAEFPLVIAVALP